MMGIDTQDLRRMTEEGVEAIMALLRYDGQVSRKTDWFELRNAALQLRPYSEELEIRVAGMLSPSGPRLAGRHGTGLFQFGAVGEGLLDTTWKVLQASAAEHGTTVTRDQWSVLHHIYVAETEEQAREEAKWGLEAIVEMLSTIVPMFATKPSTFDGLVDEINKGAMVIGTPEMAIERIQTILDQSGGVGTFIIGNNECASPENMRKSFSLIARHVLPHFNGQAATRLEAVRRAAAFGANASGLANAQAKATAEWEAHQGGGAGA
jgi:limonene 1,2-monooxygenase